MPSVADSGTSADNAEGSADGLEDNASGPTYSDIPLAGVDRGTVYNSADNTNQQPPTDYWAEPYQSHYTSQPPVYRLL